MEKVKMKINMEVEKIEIDSMEIFNSTKDIIVKWDKVRNFETLNSWLSFDVEFYEGILTAIHVLTYSKEMMAVAEYFPSEEVGDEIRGKINVHPELANIYNGIKFQIKMKNAILTAMA